jgi:hypothetical protein
MEGLAFSTAKSIGSDLNETDGVFTIQATRELVPGECQVRSSPTNEESLWLRGGGVPCTEHEKLILAGGLALVFAVLVAVAVAAENSATAEQPASLSASPAAVQTICATDFHDRFTGCIRAWIAANPDGLRHILPLAQLENGTFKREDILGAGFGRRPFR